MSFNPFRKFVGSDRPRNACSQSSRGGGNRFHVLKLSVDFNQNLINAVNDIAMKRGVSLYGQIRDFVEQGVRDYNNDERISHGDEDTAPWEPSQS